MFLGPSPWRLRAPASLLIASFALLALSACGEAPPAAGCGDGIVQAGEACDDGNRVDGDACTNACQLPTCGDGIVRVGVEGCDDGNRVDTDGCTNACRLPTCGDGIVQAGEACDDGNQVDTDACTNACQLATCGDGIVQTGVEACDDGNAVSTDGCTNACQPAVCGDGIVQAGVEACDDGNAIDTDACTSACKLATCGDGIVQAGEACDDGNQVNEDACTSTCQLPACGDGFVQAGERCDDGNRVDGDACTNACQPAACGDGIVQVGVEQCDDANAVDTDGCTTACKLATCGDGIVQAGVEQCDDGNQSNTDACTSACQVATCGDGFVQAGVEQCDDGNQSNTDACTSTCVVAACGDGLVQAGVEQCDDGNAVNADGCSNACRLPACGDGIIQLGAGETCDDGNTTSGDGCDSTCHTEPMTTTAPVKVSGALACTTAVANAAHKIAVDGSGTIYAVLRCGSGAQVVVSTDRGQTFSAPQDLSVDLPGAPVTVAQAAVATGPTGVAYVAMELSNGEVHLKTTQDSGHSWAQSVLVGTSTSTSSGLSLAAFNDDVYVGYAASGGVAVGRNAARGAGTFDTTLVTMTIAFFDLLYDPTARTLAVCADTPGFHVRVSADQGVSFGAEVNPPGQEYYSDWAFGNGRIFVSGTNLGASGNSTGLYVIPSADVATSSVVWGLPAVTTAQTRSLTADTAGNAYVVSQLNAGGVQLDRLVAGATSFDAPRSLSATGGSPVAAGLPASNGVAVAFTVGTEVWVTVQAY